MKIFSTKMIALRLLVLFFLLIPTFSIHPPHMVMKSKQQTKVFGMRASIALVTCLILLIGVHWVNSQGFDVYTQLATTIFSKLGGLFDDGQFELMGHNCQYSTKPSFAKFKLTYKGKVWCPGWTGITGRSRTKSRSGSTEHAIKDFVNQAKNNGLISHSDAEGYLSTFG